MSEPRTHGPIVSLLPAATEMIVALGAWERLAGVTHECDFPPEVRSLPVVTSSRLDAELGAAAVDAAVREAFGAGQPLFVLDEPGIRALRPTVLVTQGLCEVCAVSEAQVRRLAASLPDQALVISLGARTLDDVLASLLQLAGALGIDGTASEAHLGLHARLRRVHETLKAARAPRPRVAVIEWTEPLFTAGHWVPDMVRRAGGIDVLATSGAHSAPVRAEDVESARPDVVVFAPCGYALDRAVEAARETLARPEWGWAHPLRLAAMDGNALTSRPGPRLIDGVEVMARLFHPALFSPLAPGRGALILHV
ncbi:MAG: ABC transporter substrate-binding protein [Gemmatimonadota bacterium]